MRDTSIFQDMKELSNGQDTFRFFNVGPANNVDFWKVYHQDRNASIFIGFAHIIKRESNKHLFSRALELLDAYWLS